MTSGVYIRSEATKQKISMTKKGKKLSEETKRKIGIANVISQKGKKLSEETKRKISINNARYWKNKKRSKETKQKISLAKKGYKPLTCFKNGHVVSEETKKKMSDLHKGAKNYFYGKKHTKEAKKKMSEYAKLHIENKMKNLYSHFEKSSLELKFEQICQKLNLPYKFVGNGEFILGGKCPDFINTNGEKIAIEVYNTKNKIYVAKISPEQYRQKRIAHFSKYGWKVVFFDETQIKEEIVKKLLWQK